MKRASRRTSGTLVTARSRWGRFGRTIVGRTRARTRASPRPMPNRPVRGSETTTTSASCSSTPSWSRAASRASATVLPVVSTHSMTIEDDGDAWSASGFARCAGEPPGAAVLQAGSPRGRCRTETAWDAEVAGPVRRDDAFAGLSAGSSAGAGGNNRWRKPFWSSLGGFGVDDLCVGFHPRAASGPTTP